jgi:hypothetical protein
VLNPVVLFIITDTKNGAPIEATDVNLYKHLFIHSLIINIHSVILKYIV